jgi:hypothetical protein
VTFVLKQSQILAASKRGRLKAQAMAAAKSRPTPSMPIVRWLSRPDIPITYREGTGLAPKSSLSKMGDQITAFERRKRYGRPLTNPIYRNSRGTKWPHFQTTIITLLKTLWSNMHSSIERP